METGNPQNGENTNDNTNTPPTFDDKQQSFINDMFDKRFAKIQSKHEAEVARLKKERDDAKTAADAAASVSDANKDGNNKDGKNEAEEAQYKALLEGQKREAEAAKQSAIKAQEEAKKTREEMSSLKKSQAIRDAATTLDNGLEFHELSLVETLVGPTVSFDEDSNQYVVKENGVIKKNASLLPMTLKEYLTGFAAERPYLVRGTTKGGAGSSEGSRKSSGGAAVVRSKADLKTVAEKSDYITNFGYDAWEKLPAK
jgi:hypothetical protein